MVLDTTTGAIIEGYEENESQRQRSLCKSKQTAFKHERHGAIAKSENHRHEELLC